MRKKKRKTGKKRFLAVLLCLCMIVTMLPIGSVSAAEQENGTATGTVAYEALEGTKGYDNENYENLVDGDTSKKWCIVFGGKAYIIWKASEPLDVTGYSITTCRNPDMNPKSWTLYGANERLGKDDVGWNILDKVTGDTALQENNTATTHYTIKEEMFGYSKGVIARVGVEDFFMAGNNYKGGICGYMSGGNINNCYAIGTVAQYNSLFQGGLGGHLENVKISNCYSFVRKSGYGNGLPMNAIMENCDVKKCYYGPDEYNISADNDIVYQSSEEFASGKTAYLLQQDCEEEGKCQSTLWGQKLTGSADAYPVFDTEGSRQVYQTNGCVTYSNNPEDQARQKEHAALKKGICPDCGKYVTETERPEEPEKPEKPEEDVVKKVSYLDENGKKQLAENVKVVANTNYQWKGTETAPAWYVVRGEVSLEERITVSGEVHLILADGCNLQATQGIHVAEGNKLIIYAQSEGKSTGKVTAMGYNKNAGIGGGDAEDGGEITIQGGSVTAAAQGFAAGIGGGNDGAGGTITIRGGSVTATGRMGAGIGGGDGGAGGKIMIQGGIVIAVSTGTSNGGSSGAAIGGGSSGTGGEIIIQGGTVTATAEKYGAGIGGGNYKDGGKITILGGNIHATGTYEGAGIGGGYHAPGGDIMIQGGTVTAIGAYRGAAIGGGYSAAGGNITISGGVITATGIEAAGIGGGRTSRKVATPVSGGTFQTQTGETSVSKGNALIFASSITDTGEKDSWNGLIVYDAEGRFYGTMTEAVIDDTVAIQSDRKMTIKNGRKLTIKRGATLTNNGTLEVESGGSLINQGILANNGSVKIESGGNFNNSEGFLQQNGTYDNQDTESVEQTSGTVQKRLVITNITAEDRKFDGTDRVKVQDMTLSGIDAGDRVSIQIGDVSAVLDSSKPGTYKKIKSLAGKVILEGVDAGKYYVDLTQQDSPSVNGGKGVAIHKNMDRIVRIAADKSYLCTRDHSGSINITNLFDKTWGNIVKTTVKVLDEEGTDIQATVQWTANIEKYDKCLLNYTIKAGDAGKRKLVTVVQTEYYENIEIVVDVTLLSKYDVQVQKGSKVTTDKEGITYGQNLTQIELKDTIFTDEYGNVVPGVLSWKDPFYVPSGTETTAVWVFTPLNDAFATLEGETSITVHKQKTHMIEMPTVETILTYGQKLSDADITGGSVENEKGESVSGTFEWKNPEQIPTAVESGKAKYEVVYKPDESGNYSECETALNVTVMKADKAPVMPATVMTVPYTTKRLDEILLPEDWQWQANESGSGLVLEVGVPFEAFAVYIGKDKGNYEAESVSIMITRNTCTHSNTEIRDAKKATCTQDGYSGDSYCTDCGAKVTSGELIKAFGHKLTEVRAKEATATEAGNKAYFVCESCGRYFVDRDGKIEITDKSSVIIPAKGTTPVEPSNPSTPTPGTSSTPTQKPGGTSTPSATPSTTPSTVPTTVPTVTPSTAPVKQNGTKIKDSTGTTYIVTDAKSKIPTVQYKTSKSGIKGTVTIPTTVTIDKVTYKVTSIADNAFKGNKKIKKVVIGNSIVSIGKNAFSKCINLTSITIGKNVTQIGKNAFAGCKKLKSVVIRSKKLTKKSVARGAFSGIGKKTVVKVPTSKYKAYKKLLRAKGLSKKVKIKKN